jgi:hypothetical protein
MDNFLDNSLSHTHIMREQKNNVSMKERVVQEGVSNLIVQITLLLKNAHKQYIRIFYELSFIYWIGME